MSLFKYLLLISLCFFFSVIGASNENISPVSSLLKHLNAVKTMKAKFTQEIKEGQKIIQSSDGEIFLQRKNKFRWVSTLPTSQLIISNGDVIWIYDEDLEQVSIKKVDENNQTTPIFLLSSYQSTLEKDYYVELTHKKDTETYHLVPKNNSDNSYTWIDLTYKNNVLFQIILKDKLDQITKLSLRDVSINMQLSQGLFSFVPPKGIDVVY